MKHLNPLNTLVYSTSFLFSKIFIIPLGIAFLINLMIIDNFEVTSIYLMAIASSFSILMMKSNKKTLVEAECLLNSKPKFKETVFHFIAYALIIDTLFYFTGTDSALIMQDSFVLLFVLSLVSGLVGNYLTTSLYVDKYFNKIDSKHWLSIISYLLVVSFVFWLLPTVLNPFIVYFSSFGVYFLRNEE